MMELQSKERRFHGMDEKITSYAIMFADIAGSTQLYEKLGDVAAEQRLSKSVQLMIDIVQSHGGVLIKTIGDEVMCRFETPRASLKAACDIQLQVQKQALLDSTQPKVRIGIHFGSIIFKDGDVFGDTVNVAARMAGLARAEQIITTSDTITGSQEDGMDGQDIASRRIDALYVKGKSIPIDVHEVLWDADDSELTTVFSPSVVLSRKAAWRLELSYQDKHSALSKEQPSLVMGRGAQCEMVINSKSASRTHAKFESRRGKAVLIDQSTNGTFVKLNTGEEIFLHKEELPLAQDGSISLGLPNDENVEHLIHFSCSRKNQ